jgi:hypothetical protein
VRISKKGNANQDPKEEKKGCQKKMELPWFVAIPKRFRGRGNFEVFEELFAADFIDHSPRSSPPGDRWRNPQMTSKLQRQPCRRFD